MRVTGIEYVCFSCFCLRIIRCDRSTWYHFSYCFFFRSSSTQKYCIRQVRMQMWQKLRSAYFRDFLTRREDKRCSNDVHAGADISKLTHLQRRWNDHCWRCPTNIAELSPSEKTQPPTLSDVPIV